MIPYADRLRTVLGRDDTIIFVGSGVSVWSGLPTWYGLLTELVSYVENAGKNSYLIRRELANSDLLLAASYGFDQLTPNERCEFLRSIFRASPFQPSLLHREITQLGPSCFITTNYDGLLERALLESRPSEVFDVVTPLQQLEISSIIQSRAKGFIFKPHGDIGSCDSIILTREDYRQLQGGWRNVLEAMRTLLASRPAIFIGFGLRDPDFLLIQDHLMATFGVNPTDHYALVPDVIPEEIDYWRRSYGIHLIPYSTNQNLEGADKHRAILDLLKSVKPLTGDAESIIESHDYSGRILALARHSRRILSTIATPDSIIPLQLEQDRTKTSDDTKGWLKLGEDSLGFLESSRDKMILEGAPGSGKTFLIEQAAREIAQELERACLARPSTRNKHHSGTRTHSISETIGVM